MKSTITFTNNITVENYNALRAAVDWIQVTEKRASIALQHSFYLCVAMDGERPVGMARIVSDGGYTFYYGCHCASGLSRVSYWDRTDQQSVGLHSERCDGR